MKTEIDRLLFVLITKKTSKIFCKIEFFSFLKPNLVYLCPLLSFIPFPKFSKQNFMYFGHKHNKKKTCKKFKVISCTVISIHLMHR